MHAPLLTPLQKSLLDGWQRDFPLVARPFARLAEMLGCDEESVLAATADLLARGMVSRLGLVVRPNTAGASTLAALACHAHEVDAMAELVSAEPGVNHNYEREHPELPIWFVATGSTRADVDATLARISARTGRDVLDLPLVREYRIDLGFPLEGPCRAHHHAPASRAPSDDERRAVAALADGLEAVERPFAAPAERLGLSEADLLALIESARVAGVVKRVGYIVRHRPLGFAANAMCVFDVAEDEVDAVAEAFKGSEAVTLLYRRRPVGPRWPYALYAMIHGRDRAVVEGEVAALVARWPKRLPHRILFSTRCFKQTGARLTR